MSKFAAIMAETAKATVRVGAVELNLTYRPSVYSYRFMAELDTISVPAALCKLVAEWDLDDGEGNPYPLTEKALEELPVTVLRALWDGIRESLFPNSIRGGTTDSANT